MTYISLARKWRPTCFSDVIGQDHIIRLLQGAIRKGKLAHAFLFSGTRGLGKTTVARLLAKIICCENSHKQEPCNVCTQCFTISSGHSSDVLEIDGASNNSIDDIRNLKEFVRHHPINGRHKVIIIDEVQMLSNSAFNGLLKLIEEPPLHVKFIFATTDIEKIPVTIVSRCQKYDFKKISCKDMVVKLQEVAIKERIPIKEKGLYLIALTSDGSMRDALSLLDQVGTISHVEITEKHIVELIGLAEQSNIDKVVDAILYGHSRCVIQEFNKLCVQGKDEKRILDALIERLRNILLQAISGSFPEMSNFNPEYIEFIRTRAFLFSQEDLQRILFLGYFFLNQIKRNENFTLLIELALIKMTKRPKVIEKNAIEAKIRTLVNLSKCRKERLNEHKKWIILFDKIYSAIPSIAYYLTMGTYDAFGNIWISNKSFYFRLKVLFAMNLFKSQCLKYHGFFPILFLEN
ncbi:MAG: DNA polymerase III subunit gamma/tau [Deltaproteobacteria bacterium]|nr:MAG: DNA polymerase III subunit gamma/tau [Deltaproteobacteria bacterium]